MGGIGGAVVVNGKAERAVASKWLILTAMIFAVSMTFIDQTIVSIAVPDIQEELSLTSTGVQWAVNAYLLAMASFFAFGGRIADTEGHRKMVVIGVVVFAGASALCGLTPTGDLARRISRGSTVVQRMSLRTSQGRATVWIRW